MKTKLREKYIVMRHTGRDAWTTGPFGPPRMSIRKESPFEADLKFEHEELENTEAETLSRDSSVITLAPTMPMKLYEPVKRQANANPNADNTWGITAVKADQSVYTGKGVTVSVLDTGIDINHPSFQDMPVVEKDFTGEGDGDNNGHGTHCAGTIITINFYMKQTDSLVSSQNL